MRVPDEIRDCVCFIETWRAGIRTGIGSAFFVGVHIDMNDMVVPYVVTAKHCVRDVAGVPDDVALRINMRKGGSEVIHTDPSGWLLHPSADVAVIPINPNPAIVQYRIYPLLSAATRDFIDERGIGPGDDVFMPGLLIHHPGKTRIMPVVRIGTIAALPEDPVNLETGEDVVGLLEVRSIGGVSGSPVFVHLPFWRDTEKGQSFVSMGGKADSGGENWLLGVMHGFYPVGRNDPDDVSGGDEDMNTGIAVVVLVDRIMDLINRGDQVMMRENAKKQVQASQMPKPATATSGEFEQFEDLTRKIVQIPKTEIDKKRAGES
jgi:hypothetical protein